MGTTRLPVCKAAKDVEGYPTNRYCPLIESLGDAGRCLY